ncbi:MAG: helix-turn-helix domain-containing protein [Nevskiales bacterium]|nr:helix-turn-helix domain-containing protein [Nevskiales bacterium]
MNEKPAIAEIVDLLSKKWVMRIIWELRAGPLTFRQLQSACNDLSPTVLNNRLKLLRDAQLALNDPSRGYTLTDMGRDLLEVYKPLNQWAIAWQAAKNDTPETRRPR